MDIIDAQIHNLAPAATWEFGEASKIVLECELLVAAIDAVGVGGAVLAPRHDARFAEVATQRYPDRFRRVVHIDPEDAQVEARVAEARRDPTVVALRQVVADYMGDEGAQALRRGAYDRLFEAAEDSGLPMFLLAPGFAADLAPVATRYPRLTMIVDHFGLRQYPPLTMDQPDPWERLPGLLSLAEYDNVAVKFCGAQLLSREPYPHRDVWPQLHRVIDAFGVDRLIWASDFTRLRMVKPGERWRGDYGQALAFVRDSEELSGEDKAKLLGATARRVLGWEPAGMSLFATERGVGHGGS